jgi:hypothetical protein
MKAAIMHPPASRALRREVGRLATLDPADLDAVLADLEPVHAARIRDLLRQALGLPQPEVPVRTPAWLAERAEGQVAGMTERARKELARCIAQLIPGAAAASAPPVRGRSLFDQTMAALGRKTQ